MNINRICLNLRQLSSKNYDILINYRVLKDMCTVLPYIKTVSVEWSNKVTKMLKINYFEK